MMLSPYTCFLQMQHLFSNLLVCFCLWDVVTIHFYRSFVIVSTSSVIIINFSLLYIKFDMITNGDKTVI